MYGGAPGWKFDYYSYEAYRRKYQDDIREVPRVTLMSLDQEELNRYIELLKRGKRRLATLDNESIYELMSIKRGEKVTLSATLLFSPYPQAYFPQLCITAIVIPGRTIGSLGDMGERFSDNQRIEGTIPEMLDEALLFVKRNMRTKTIISPTTGRRTDRTDYPITAVREAIINALVHRDYSIHTEGMPIQLIMFEDRIEIHNPGGLYGRITIDQLGKIQPDTRNLVLASALETLGITENNGSDESQLWIIKKSGKFLQIYPSNSPDLILACQQNGRLVLVDKIKFLNNPETYFYINVSKVAMPAEAASGTLERPKVYWEDETMFAENKEPGCATYIPYITEKEMLADKDFYRTPWLYSQSSSFKLLNGNWYFHFVSKPSQRPESFYKEDYDVSSWETIPVPSNWEMQGYDLSLIHISEPTRH